MYVTHAQVCRARLCLARFFAGNACAGEFAFLFRPPQSGYEDLRISPTAARPLNRIETKLCTDMLVSKIKPCTHMLVSNLKPCTHILIPMEQFTVVLCTHVTQDSCKHM